MNQKALINLKDKDLRDGLRNKTEHVQYSYTDYRDEMFRRSQVRSANAMNILTFVIAVATIINVAIFLVK